MKKQLKKFIYNKPNYFKKQKEYNLCKLSLKKSINFTAQWYKQYYLNKNKIFQFSLSQIKKFGGNISKTAKFVGMERSALHRKLKLLGVKDLN